MKKKLHNYLIMDGSQQKNDSFYAHYIKFC